MRDTTLSAPGRDIKPGPDPVRRTNLTTLILYRLRDFAIAQGLVEGDRLPPERELAARLSVSRPTLRDDNIASSRARRQIRIDMGLGPAALGL